jgi:hypothetical protein
MNTGLSGDWVSALTWVGHIAAFLVLSFLIFKTNQLWSPGNGIGLEDRNGSQ